MEYQGKKYSVVVNRMYEVKWLHYEDSEKRTVAHNDTGDILIVGNAPVLVPSNELWFYHCYGCGFKSIKYVGTYNQVVREGDEYISDSVLVWDNIDETEYENLFKNESKEKKLDWGKNTGIEVVNIDDFGEQNPFEYIEFDYYTGNGTLTYSETNEPVEDPEYYLGGIIERTGFDKNDEEMLCIKNNFIAVNAVIHKIQSIYTEDF